MYQWVTYTYQCEYEYIASVMCWQMRSWYEINHLGSPRGLTDRTSCHNVVKTSVWCSLLFRLRWSTSLPVSSATSDLSRAVYCQQCHPASPINHHLTLKHRETHECVVSTAAKAPGHQYPQCWLNIHCIWPVSYKNTTLMLDNITRVENQITFWRNKRTESSKSTWPQCSFYNTHER